MDEQFPLIIEHCSSSAPSKQYIYPLQTRYIHIHFDDFGQRYMKTLLQIFVSLKTIGSQ